MVEARVARSAATDRSEDLAARLRALMSNVPGAFYRCRVDDDWTMEFISDEIQRITGHPASDFVRNQERTFASVIHPDDRTEVAEQVEAAVGRGEPFELEYRVLTADGHERTVLERGQLVTGSRSRWLDGVIFDITERRHAEEELRRSRGQEAAQEERLRIARDLHDVVGHAISIATVQAGGARAVLRRDPDRAEQALLAAQAAMRDALAEMRWMLAVLDGGGRSGDRLASLPDVVQEVAAAGLDVAHHVEGVPRALPARVALTLHRVAQEALTNCLKHAAGARAVVVVRYGPDDVELEVRDDGSGCVATTVAAADDRDAGGGRGLRGIAERVREAGGEVSAGPVDGGGFRVVARIPLAADAT